MRKLISIVLLATISGAWAISSACGVGRAPENLPDNAVTLYGAFQSVPAPCYSDVCATCMTYAFYANGTLYYLSSSDEQIRPQLDIEVILPATHAIITGKTYTRADDNWLDVQSLTFTDNPIPSLCDTWNVLQTDNVSCGGCETYRTNIHRLGTDTIIGEQHYLKLLNEGKYAGALREGNNRDIYCIPAGTTHEYLLYAFNAQVGDELTNLWLGGHPSECPDGWTATIKAINETTPRTFMVEAQIKYWIDEPDTHIWLLPWIEGVGLFNGPVGREGCLACGNSRTYDVLCAYKDGEQVYASPYLSSKFGCYYNGGVIDDVEPLAPDTHAAQKTLRNGQLLILRDGKTYTAQGQEIR